MPKLKLVEAETLHDWYFIERAEHDGREWLEQVGPNTSVLRSSSRICDADIEGSGFEMLTIASAIKDRRSINFKRCAVDFKEGNVVELWSPRNSQHTRGRVSLAEADELADEIIAELEP